MIYCAACNKPLLPIEFNRLYECLCGVVWPWHKKFKLIKQREVAQEALLEISEEKPMKKYQCHKIVEGMLIDTMDVSHNGSVTLVGHDKEAHFVTKEWMERHKPGIGGYFVRYEDGYESWSPAQTFEAGYTALKEDGTTELFNPLVSELLTLLDAIETECEVGYEDPARLAAQRFDILKKYGYNPVFHGESSTEKH